MPPRARKAPAKKAQPAATESREAAAWSPTDHLPTVAAPKPAPFISVLLPSRARADALAESVGSLRHLAADPSRIEVLVAADPDDDATRDVARELGCELLVADERYGYTRLNEYFNRLAERARGEWLLLWNDDARMQTQGWDTVVRDAGSGAAVLWPDTNHSRFLNVFPVVAKRMTDALGHFSLSPHSDSWVQDVADAAGLQKHIAVTVLHDRKDMTGGHDDALAAENAGAYKTAEYHSDGMRALREADVVKLREAFA